LILDLCSAHNAFSGMPRCFFGSYDSSMVVIRARSFCESRQHKEHRSLLNASKS
jgi:hypothetical protein